jgi:hypothetical protein
MTTSSRSRGGERAHRAVRRTSYDEGGGPVPAALPRPARRDSDHAATRTRTRQARPTTGGRAMKEGLEP